MAWLLGVSVVGKRLKIFQVNCFVVPRSVLRNVGLTDFDSESTSVRSPVVNLNCFSVLYYSPLYQASAFCSRFLLVNSDRYFEKDCCVLHNVLLFWQRTGRCHFHTNGRNCLIISAFESGTLVAS